MSPLVITTMSAALSMGPIFLGVPVPLRLSMTQMASTSRMWGEQRLHRPALSLTSTSSPSARPHCTHSSTLLTK